MTSAAASPSSPRAAKPARGFWPRNRYLVLRRASQLLIVLVFLCGPWFGLWLVKGNISASLILGTLPLTDPWLFVQSVAAGQWPYRTALIGAAIVTLFYLLIGGRVFCSWVCPVNALTDAAAWLRRRLGIKTGRTPDAQTRHWLLAGTLLAAALSGTLVWEWVNPVSLLHRALIFGLAGAWPVLVALFAYDLLVAQRGWCGHLCPVGAFYSLLNRGALLRVSAARRSACDDCLDCFVVCPEPQVIRPALKAVGQDHPLILSSQCTTCARCIDVCDQNVFKLTHRFDQRSV